MNGCTSSCYNNGLHFSVFNHANCNSWDKDCTVNSNNTNCAVKTCANFTGTVNYSNCYNWLSTCTNASGNTACIEKTCYNHLTNISIWLYDSVCASFKSDCNSAWANQSCEPNYCTDFADTTLANCQSRESYCLLG